MLGDEGELGQGLYFPDSNVSCCLKLGDSLSGQELARKVRDGDSSELWEGIQEVNEAREETELPSLRETSPRVVLRNKAMPVLVQQSHGEKLLFGSEEPANYGKFKLTQRR